MAFAEMGIMPEICKAVDEIEWSLPTDIQSEAIPLILGGGDVLMAAETGSGKTGAFCLPVLQITWETLNEDPKKAKSSVVPSWSLCHRDRNENLVIHNDGLSCQSKGNNIWAGVRSSLGVRRSRNSRDNRFYYEVSFNEAGLARVGWALGHAKLDLGTDKFGYGYGATGKKSNNRDFSDYGEAFGDRGDVIGNVIDLDSGAITWIKNGKFLGEAFRVPRDMLDQTFFPCVCPKNAQVVVKFSSTAEKSSLPPTCTWVGNASESQKAPNPVFDSSSKSSQNIVPGPKAIVIEPSRELAEQTFNCLVSFKKYLPGELNVILLIGGGNARDQIAQIKNGADIVVATPGRLDDLVSNGSLALKQCRFFVLDEVDGLLQQGNIDLINRLHSQIPRMFDDGRRLQMIVCSATLHNFEVKKLAEKLMYFPTWIDLKGQDSVPETVHHCVCWVDPRTDSNWKHLKRGIETDQVHSRDRLNYNQPNAETLSEAVKKLKGEYAVKAIDALKIDQAIIFCRTKLDCDNLEDYLNNLGGGAKNPDNPYSCVCLHADRSPQDRKANLDKFKQLKCKFLICTDVAARGIDIKGVPYVIQLTLPDEKANYVHRIGRVGRADRMGLAISLVSKVPEKVWYHKCNSRGKNCNNAYLLTEGGCCIWYNEIQLLAEIEEHLGCTVSTVENDFKLEINEFDGKVVYGAKRAANQASLYKTHVQQMSNEVKTLAQLELSAQQNYLRIKMMKV